MLVALTAVVLVAAAGLYWFQPWRLVTDHEVQDSLPAVSARSIDQSEPAAVTQSGPAAVTQSASAPAGPRVLAAGNFVSHEHDTRGTAQLVRLADGRHQLVLRDLETSDGPDLRVWLTDREVLTGRAGWQIFDDGRSVEIAELKGNSGNQVYDIPAGTDLAGLRSVSIWCKRFSVSFGAAALR
ncbi:DM13 domain-containing protein [Winogradskya consettensis]|nr:DM13 domain-containing protein [Actinoplanes consettensis]